MNNLIDMEFVNRKYYEKSNQKVATNKNQAADLLHEVADAMGADLSLMKEGQVSNQRYIIHESDLGHICKMLDRAKEPDGKRLRCRDYRGAGAECIDFFIEAFCHLFMVAGCTKGRCNLERIAMQIKTEFVSMIASIENTSPQFIEDIDKRFFAPNEEYPVEEDYLKNADKFIFLHYMEQYPYIKQEELRAIYWCFRNEAEKRDMHDLMVEVRKFQKLDESGVSEFKENLLRRVRFDKALEKDSAYQDALDEWYRVESGQGKLQDNKRMKTLVEKVCSEMDRIAAQHLVPAKSGATGAENTQKEADKLYRSVKEAEYLLQRAIIFFISLANKRLEKPISTLPKGQETSLEWMFQERFGVPMFEWLEFE